MLCLVGTIVTVHMHRQLQSKSINDISFIKAASHFFTISPTKENTKGFSPSHYQTICASSGENNRSARPECDRCKPRPVAY